MSDGAAEADLGSGSGFVGLRDRITKSTRAAVWELDDRASGGDRGD
jgi:hypothetical protein